MDAATATTIQAIAAAISAVSTVVLVGVTIYYAVQTRRTVREMERSRTMTGRTVEEMHNQVAVAREQVGEMRAQRTLDEESRYLAQRPVVYPVEPLAEDMMPADSASLTLVWDRRECAVVLANAGGGIATELCGVLMGPDARPVVNPRYTLWKAVPLRPTDAPVSMTMIGSASKVGGAACIGSRSLEPPLPPSLDDMAWRATPYVIARLTLTYRDVFGCKHASMVDYTSMQRWENAVFLPNITQDLEDLERGYGVPPSAQIAEETAELHVLGFEDNDLPQTTEGTSVEETL